MNPANPPIVYPLKLQLPELTAFSTSNVIVALACTLLLAALVLRSPQRIGRFSMLVAGALNVFSQWPLAFLSTPVEQSLANEAYFALSIHIPVLCFIGWVWFARPLEPQYSADAGVSVKDLIVPSAAMFGFLGVFLFFMPYYCTALYAMVFDPSLTLLAREVTIKLAGSTIATSSYGAVVNSAAPAVAGLSLLLVVQSARSRKISMVLACFGLLAASFFATLLPGAKGLLVSLVIVVTFCAVGSFRSLWAKSFALLFFVSSLCGLLVAFELYRERGGRDAPYDFAGCVISLGSVETGRELLISMVSSGGLTLSAKQVEELLGQLEQRSGKVLQPFAVPDARPPSADRAWAYVAALAARTFIVPIQAAAWHHLYVEEHGSPGIGTLPLALKLLGYSVDATSLVYHAYGTIYSGGDATSTSTAPTNYFVAYSAYFGWIGVAAAMVLTILVDTIAALFMRRLSRPLFWLSAGLLGVMAANAIGSDLWTVMVSHGGAVGLALIMTMGIAHRRSASEVVST